MRYVQGASGEVQVERLDAAGGAVCDARAQHVFPELLGA
jgi:hypothetical protein